MREFTRTEQLAIEGIKSRISRFKNELNNAAFEMDDHTWDVLWDEAQLLMDNHRVDGCSIEDDLVDIFDEDDDLIREATAELDYDCDDTQVEVHTCLRAGREWKMINELKDSQKKAGDKITSLKKEIENYKFAIKEAGYKYFYDYETKRGVIQRD